MKKISTDIVGEASVPAHENAVIVASNDDFISSRIFSIRGVQVILDRDIARLYGVETGALNRQVKRNIERFPDDFMFRLTEEEWQNLRCHFGISSWGGDRQHPYAFTEQGVSMLSGVLRSRKAAHTCRTR